MREHMPVYCPHCTADSTFKLEIPARNVQINHIKSGNTTLYQYTFDCPNPQQKHPDTDVISGETHPASTRVIREIRPETFERIAIVYDTTAVEIDMNKATMRDASPIDLKLLAKSIGTDEQIAFHNLLTEGEQDDFETEHAALIQTYKNKGV